MGADASKVKIISETLIVLLRAFLIDKSSEHYKQTINNGKKLKELRLSN